MLWEGMWQVLGNMTWFWTLMHLLRGIRRSDEDNGQEQQDVMILWYERWMLWCCDEDAERYDAVMRTPDAMTPWWEWHVLCVLLRAIDTVLKYTESDWHHDKSNRCCNENVSHDWADAQLEGPLAELEACINDCCILLNPEAKKAMAHQFQVC